ncbi:MAG: PEP-CTERM sorting domain-containing protein [Planctomycetales bacterium]|nr:PEP-CTERM sorting domain-containing protein [Planctomycetales bacterium]
MTRLRFFPLGVLGVVLAVSIGRAEVVPLSDLVNGGTVQSGDKVFSNFTYLVTGDMPAAGDVNVETITDQDGKHGLRFQGGFTDVSGGSSSDAVITFDVSVAPGNGNLISGATLAANPAVFNGEGLASITETFLPDVTDDKLVVYDFGGGDDKLLDSTVFANALATLHVQKDIILHATGENAGVTLSFVDQTFEQVPEPATLSLLLGALGLIALRRRRSA